MSIGPRYASIVIFVYISSAPGLQQQWQELPPVEKPLERVSLDLTDMVAGNQGYRYVLTITDRYSRYVKFFPLKTKNTGKVCALFAQYISDFGVAKVVLVDNGREFTSQTFHSLCNSQNITIAYTTPYHPQGNSITERMHRTLKSILACLCE